MSRPRPEPDDANASAGPSSTPSRRTFLQAGATSVLLAASASHAEAARPVAPPATPEWRNKQPGMAYRRLGRTNLMVSEFVAGGDPITLENFKHLELALEMGLNYLDMAPAYNNGDTERAYGKFLAGSSSRREKVFLTTKVSEFNKLRHRLYQEAFDALPEAKRKAILGRKAELLAARGVEAPGYFLTYFPGQREAIEGAYLRVAMLPEHGPKIEGCKALRQVIVDSLEGSLGRLGVDHVDILMCPHGSDTPEDLSPEVAEVFADLKRQGKVRFLGTTSHNDPAGVLRAAADLGYYDLAMVAYNVINAGYLDAAIGHAASRDLGLIAMKAAHAVATHHKELQPVPAWRVAKVERIIQGDWSAPQKAYLWALQDPRITAVISNLWDEKYVRENLGLAGKKVALHSA